MKSALYGMIAFLSDPMTSLKGILIFLIGPLDVQIAYLVLAIGIDLVFGTQVARNNRDFKWKIFFLKIRRKLFVYGLWIAMFHAFDMVAGLPSTARYTVIVLLAGLEIVSAIKNTARLGHGHLANALESAYLSLIKNNHIEVEHEKKKDRAVGEEGGSGNDE